MSEHRIGYLVCNENGVSFPEYSWSEGTTHETDNPNYIFFAYKDLNVASFIQPALDNIQNPIFWEVKLWGGSHDDPMRINGSKCEAIKLHKIQTPTDSQRFNFAALLSMNYLKNENFIKWTLGYLSGQDKSKETAQNFSEKIMLDMCLDVPDDKAYLSSAHALLESVISGDYRLRCACSAHRLIWDAPTDLDVTIFAKCAMMLSENEVFEVIKSNAKHI